MPLHDRLPAQTILAAINQQAQIAIDVVGRGADQFPEQAVVRVAANLVLTLGVAAFELQQFRVCGATGNQQQGQ